MDTIHRIITKTLLPVVLVIIAGGTRIAQTQGSVSGQQNVDSQSSIEMSKQAANPLASLSLMQFQQSTTWAGLSSGYGDGTQSNLQFQPLIPFSLTKNWSLITRPVLQLYSSIPYVTPAGQVERQTGFGDTVLAFALSPGHELVGKWLLAAGPTFILPTATETMTGQEKWQFGPTAAVGYAGEHFLTYIFTQQWFPIAGQGKKTNQMATYYSFEYFYSNGWSVGTEPEIYIDWEAPRSNRVTFPVGLQVGKLSKFGILPVKFDLMAQYYPVHPEVTGPKWNLQLQITPIMPQLIKRSIFHKSS